MLRIDDLILGFDKGLRTVFAQARSVRPIPGETLPEADMDAAQRAQAAALMRVNHSGEICAQALYQGQAMTARDSGARAALEHFKPLPCKIGRARLFPEKSTGAHDPGMLALALLLERSDLTESSAASLLKTVP